MVIGIILSFSLNIDALRILNFYLENPDISEKIASGADAYLKSYEEARDKMEQTFAKLTAADPEDVDTNKAAQAELDRINQSFEQISAAAYDFESQGIPIGSDYFPHCRFRVLEEGCYPCLDSEEYFKNESFDNRLWLDYTFWVLKILITGMLIGLGGPFWYDAVRGLVRTTQIFRGRGQPQEPVSGKSEGKTGPDKPAEIFEKSIDMKEREPVHRPTHESGAKGDVSSQVMRARKAADERIASRFTQT
jgi:hypothetical protein